MKLIEPLPLLLLLLVAPASSYQGHVDTVISAYLMEQPPEQVLVMIRFQSWTDQYDKDYDNEDEAWNRMHIWLQNDGTYNSTCAHVDDDDLSRRNVHIDSHNSLLCSCHCSYYRSHVM
jgi:hypothetical protein